MRPVPGPDQRQVVTLDDRSRKEMEQRRVLVVPRPRSRQKDDVAVAGLGDLPYRPRQIFWIEQSSSKLSCLPQAVPICDWHQRLGSPAEMPRDGDVLGLLRLICTEHLLPSETVRDREESGIRVGLSPRTVRSVAAWPVHAIVERVGGG